MLCTLANCVDPNKSIVGDIDYKIIKQLKFTKNNEISIQYILNIPYENIYITKQLTLHT